MFKKIYLILGLMLIIAGFGSNYIPHAFIGLIMLILAILEPSKEREQEKS